MLQTQILGAKNYRMWCMVATYGFCFGVELTMNNIVAGYLFDQFDLDLTLAGTLASCYGAHEPLCPLPWRLRL